MPLLNIKYTKDDFDGFIKKFYKEILKLIDFTSKDKGKSLESN